MTVLAQGITKSFHQGQKPAVKDVSFTAPEGRITSLLGPSGSGKSTLLRIIAGLESVDQGTVRIGDRDMTRVVPRDRQIGLVFQNYALFENMTVAKNIAFGLEVRGKTPQQIGPRVQELLSLIQLERFADRLPAQLSGGQKQRVALARALAAEPKVLLLDEPFGALDTRVRVELRTWLHQFHEKTHVTTVLVTHDQEEALELSDHVVILKDGQVEQAGSPHDLYDHPRTPFVASFLGGASVLPAQYVPIGSVPPNPNGTDSSRMTAVVRPHDVKISRLSQSPEVGPLARIQRLVRVGGYAKVSLELSDGTLLDAEIAQEEAERLKLEKGEQVTFEFSRPNVFFEDYSI
jgi:sulfate transport system ATP-binding protein